jgi:hypothetical protein
MAKVDDLLEKRAKQVVLAIVARLAHRSPPTANLAVEGITDHPNGESQTAIKPACTPGFLAKSITCSGQIIAINQSLPNSSRTTKQALEELGWVDGRNVRFDIRWGAGNDERYRMLAKELVALSPDVILGAAGSTVPALLRATRTVPIVFTQTPDPVGAGFVESLARPGGNATGFTNLEYGLSGNIWSCSKRWCRM